MVRYFIFNKPFRVLCQFSPEGDKKTLKDFNFPKNIYPLGRLDYDSEGLLILSDDKKLNHLLLNPQFNHKKTYLAQLEGDLSEEEIQNFKNGLKLNIKGKEFKSRPAEIIRMDISLPERVPPIRFRKNIPSQWYKISISEGKNRQLRKMCAAVNHPVLRLIRIAIEDIALNDLAAGEKVELSKNVVYRKLKINE
ncbi:pseudouridine synthase [Hyphobacterium sp. CCMP332]|nr:pseudouridine synthase [Hyphobacterium sp. CCMP332]